MGMGGMVMRWLAHPLVAGVRAVWLTWKRCRSGLQGCEGAGLHGCRGWLTDDIVGGSDVTTTQGLIRGRPCTRGVGVQRGNPVLINPRSVHVARLRYSFVAIELKYIIWRVWWPVDLMVMRMRAAPMIGRLVPLAECITRRAGIRSLSSRCRAFIR